MQASRLVDGWAAYGPAVTLAQATAQLLREQAMTERVLILDFGAQYTQLIGGKMTACRPS
jgi:hypothetical protein